MMIASGWVLGNLPMFFFVFYCIIILILFNDYVSFYKNSNIILKNHKRRKGYKKHKIFSILLPVPELRRLKLTSHTENCRGLGRGDRL